MAGRHPKGYAVVVDPVAGNREWDTFCCGHCGQLVMLEKRADLADKSGTCGNCWQLICVSCVGRGSCTPLEKWLEKAEARGRFLRSAGIE
jgi:hypothetical protein